jgi:hypothetical protein
LRYLAAIQNTRRDPIDFSRRGAICHAFNLPIIRFKITDNIEHAKKPTSTNEKINDAFSIRWASCK